MVVSDLCSGAHWWLFPRRIGWQGDWGRIGVRGTSLQGFVVATHEPQPFYLILNLRVLLSMWVQGGSGRRNEHFLRSQDESPTEYRPETW